MALFSIPKAGSNKDRLRVVVVCLHRPMCRRFGMLAPMLVQMERQIDREIAADQKKMGNGNAAGENESGVEEDSDSELEDEQPVLMYGPLPQIVTNDLKSLDEMVSVAVSLGPSCRIHVALRMSFECSGVLLKVSVLRAEA